MNNTLLTALGLMLVIEGILPLLLPQTWRDTFRRMVELKDGQLRFVGLASVIGGLVLIVLSN
ncbi:MAG: DUF2065 domain-containing protein [Methylotenera sp. 24-45-7]|jgi:hypothetical protein|nr:MAG: DUF2065 domain-containing protein [Mehylophilales bacterium 35-46-6]OYZ41754.1 MAG: DUF2065 domain-containing protein [Methylotenera sp. 24-45-7]OZA08235.1 MAG: DUF2065 domain-containing protein [Methylotenera sp. 17-45-7]OZA54585.1 MAG: DUF2065 domain-containing protein [Methylophilales bacterium 39-45-7]HQS36849.1 DUF2065 domain-containing protein [Methylotenera sp.]